MAEYFDLVDKDGKLTGKKKLRVEVHRDGDWHQAVSVWIKNSKGQYLLQKRAPDKDAFPNYWDNSAGGHLKSGQTFQTAALAEISEELGISVDPKELRPLFVYKNRVLTNKGAFKNNEFVQVYLLIKDLSVSKIRFQREEISALKWVSRSELERLIKSRAHIFTPDSKIEGKFLLNKFE